MAGKKKAAQKDAPKPDPKSEATASSSAERMRASLDRYKRRVQLLNALAAEFDVVIAEASAAREGIETAENEMYREHFEYAAKRLERINQQEFQDAAVRLVRLVYTALSTKDDEDIDHVIWLAKKLRGRAKREWLARCRRAVDFWHLENSLGFPRDRDRGRELAEIELAHVDEKAAALRSEFVEQVHAELLNGKLKIEGFAAHLACACGAFGYSKSDFKKARNAFANLE